MSLSVPHIIGLSSFALLLGAGQLLFKVVAERSPAINRMADVPHVLFHPLLWLALGLYAVATLLWVYLLQRVPLSRAYPFAALGFIIVPLGAAVFFGDQLTGRFLLGTAFIMVGICLAGLAPQ